MVTQLIWGGVIIAALVTLTVLAILSYNRWQVAELKKPVKKLVKKTDADKIKAAVLANVTAEQLQQELAAYADNQHRPAVLVIKGAICTIANPNKDTLSRTFCNASNCFKFLIEN